MINWFIEFSFWINHDQKKIDRENTFKINKKERQFPQQTEKRQSNLRKMEKDSKPHTNGLVFLPKNCIKHQNNQCVSCHLLHGCSFADSVFVWTVKLFYLFWGQRFIIFWNSLSHNSKHVFLTLITGFEMMEYQVTDIVSQTRSRLWLTQSALNVLNAQFRIRLLFFLDNQFWTEIYRKKQQSPKFFQTSMPVQQLSTAAWEILQGVVWTSRSYEFFFSDFFLFWETDPEKSIRFMYIYCGKANGEVNAMSRQFDVDSFGKATVSGYSHISTWSDINQGMILWTVLWIFHVLLKILDRPNDPRKIVKCWN